MSRLVNHILEVFERREENKKYELPMEAISRELKFDFYDYKIKNAKVAQQENITIFNIIINYLKTVTSASMDEIYNNTILHKMRLCNGKMVDITKMYSILPPMLHYGIISWTNNNYLTIVHVKNIDELEL